MLRAQRATTERTAAVGSCETVFHRFWSEGKPEHLLVGEHAISQPRQNVKENVMSRTIAHALATISLLGAPAAGWAAVEARTWSDAATWETDLSDDSFVPTYLVVWEDLPMGDGADIDGWWFPYWYFYGVTLLKTQGDPGITYHAGDEPWLDPHAAGDMQDQVTFLFGEDYGSGIWYEPVASFGFRALSTKPLHAAAFGTQEELLGEWTIEADSTDVWGVVADDYIIGRLVITEITYNSDWTCGFPLVIGAPVPEPSTLTMAALLGFAFMSGGRAGRFRR